MGKKIFRALGLILALGLVVGIVYISMLGENDRAAAIVSIYFDNIANQRYEANTRLCTEAYNHQFDNINDPITHQFSLETALLNHYGLINTAKYVVDTRRNGFWLPYMGNDKLHISVRVRPQESGNILTGLATRSDERYIDNLVTLIRDDGKWKIADIDIRSSIIANDYRESKTSMLNSQYIQQTADGFTIKENAISFAGLDPIRKRIIAFNLNKALTLLNDHK
jgi:hypothetical protein